LIFNDITQRRGDAKVFNKEVTNSGASLSHTREHGNPVVKYGDREPRRIAKIDNSSKTRS